MRPHTIHLHHRRPATIAPAVLKEDASVVPLNQQDADSVA